MIYIKKSAPPKELVELKTCAEKHGLTDKEGYDKLGNPLKEIVRQSLLHEQGHLCAYCMRRIPDNRIHAEDTDLSGVHIEHWIPRGAKNNTRKNRGLDYSNMLAVCSGNEKTPETNGKHRRRYFTCDKKRGDAPLKINPLDLSTLDTLCYSSNGIIKSTDSEIEEDINIRLNLNLSSDAVALPQNRKAVLDEVQQDIYSQHGDMLQNCKDQLEIWEKETDPKTPYIGIAIWWLKDQIRALSQEC